MPDTTRPDLHTVKTGAELQRWYWLKSELEDGARRHGLSRAGSKADITARLAHFLDTGEKLRPKRRTAASGFDWANAELTLDTVITDSYRNGTNVRRFFERHYEGRFTFNIAFMDWMRANTGKTLRDALAARRTIAEREKTEKPPIPASNQYNAYTRAFFAANPDRKIAEARKCWAHKRGLPGHNRYEDDDLKALGDVDDGQSR